MQIPIPNDWDGVSWRCIELQWPDSDGWLPVLFGMLSLFHRGRFWDERTGSIVGVQIAGREIWERNNPLVACGGETIPIPPEIGAGTTCGAVCWEDFEMPCLDISDLLRVEDGKLWAKDACCDWVEIGTLEKQTETLPADPLNPDGEELTYSACGKAYAGATVLFSIIDNFWDEVDNFPWQWIGHVENGVGLDLDNKWIIAGCNQSIIMQGVGYTRDDLTGDEDRRWVTCQLKNMLSDDAAGATEDQFDAIRGAIKGHMGFDPFKFNMWDYAFWALGYKDFHDITALGALDTTQDCACPTDGLNDPTGGWLGYDWVHFFDFTVGQAPGVLVGALTVWEYGTGFVDWADESTLYAKTAFKIPILNEAGAGHIKRLWWTLEIGNGFNYSGDAQRIDAANGTLAGPYSPGGDPVTLGGRITSEIGLDYTVGAASNDVTCIIEGHIVTPASGPKDPRSPKWLALAIAGTGTDPFVAA